MVQRELAARLSNPGEIPGDSGQALRAYRDIKGRGLVEILDTNALSVLSRLSREPETEEQAEILSTPIRRIEAVIAAIPVGGFKSPAKPQAAETGVSPFSSQDQTVRGQTEVRRSSEEDVTETENAKVYSNAHPTSPSNLRHRQVWHLLGGLLILAAVVWMIHVIRRS
jgi:hypothetical protein